MSNKKYFIAILTANIFSLVSSGAVLCETSVPSPSPTEVKGTEKDTPQDTVQKDTVAEATPTQAPTPLTKADLAKVEAKFTEAEELLEQNKIKSAIKKYQEIIELDINNARAYLELGLAYQSQNKFDAAISNLKTSIQLKSDNWTAYNNLGAAYFSKGLVDEAIEEYQKSLKLNPKSALLNFNIGLALREQDKDKTALKFFKKAIELDTSKFEYYYFQGETQYKLGKNPEKNNIKNPKKYFSDAIDSYKQYLELASDLEEEKDKRAIIKNKIKQLEVQL